MSTARPPIAVTTPPPTPILGIGLPLPPNIDQTSTVVTDTLTAAHFANFTLDFHIIEPSQPVENILAAIRDKLGAKSYAAVSIGYGIRADKTLTPLFEGLVDLVLREQRHDRTIGIAFPIQPGDVVASCQRAIGRG